MRPIHFAGLLLSPMLAAASAFALPPTTDAAAMSRVSTGITAPRLIDSGALRIPAEALGETDTNQASVVLSVQVDAKGTAQSVRVVKSANPVLDARVVSAVLASQFQPARLNHQAIPIEVSLTIKVQR